MTRGKFISLLILLASLECLAVQLSIPDTTVAAGDTFLIPVRTEDVTGLNVVAYELTIGFQEGILLSIDATSENTITSIWGNPVVNTNFVDQIQVISAGITPLQGQGNLVYLELQAIGSPESVTQLEFRYAIFNEGTPPVEYHVPACSVWIAGSAVPIQNEPPPSKFDLHIFPNQTNASINLRYSSTRQENTQIMLYNIAGRLVMHRKIPTAITQPGYTSIELSQLPSGYYLLALITSEHQSIKPVIIIR